MSHYVTPDDLCGQSGLDRFDLWELESAGLLRPTHTEPAPQYRPRLVGWARKLAHLRREGWTLDEIGAWARGRWETDDARRWPPRRHDWLSQGSGIIPRKGS